MELQRKAPVSKSGTQVQNENKKSFGKMCEVIMQFTSRLVEVTEKSTKVEDEKVSLTDFATMVTENNALWDEFIHEVRGSKIITNDGVLLVFEEFRRKKTTKTHKRGKEFHDTACTQKQVMNSVKVARRSSAPLISL